MITNEKPDREDFLVDQPSHEELREILFKQGGRAKRGKVLPLVPWSSVNIPANATDLEKLTYVPGLVGEITEWIVRGAPRPNRMMALCASTALVGTLIGRYIRGPTGSATHLYLIMLALSGYAKAQLCGCGTTTISKTFCCGWKWAEAKEEMMKKNPWMRQFIS